MDIIFNKFWENEMEFQKWTLINIFQYKLKDYLYFSYSTKKNVLIFYNVSSWSWKKINFCKQSQCIKKHNLLI